MSDSGTIVDDKNIDGQTPPNDGTPGEQANQIQPLVVSEDQYKSLQSEYTKTNQLLINQSVELAKVNPKSIVGISDTKLQNKVIKEIYGLNNINEVKAVYGDNFYESKKDEEIDEVDKLKRTVAMLKYDSENGKIEQSIKEFKKLNSQIFKDKPDAEEILRERLSLISNSLPIDERLDMAGKLAFGVNYVDSTTAALIEMQKGNISAGAGGTEAKDNKPDASKNSAELRAYFGLSGDKK